MSLSALFDPRGVAVIGAAREPGKVGHIVLANLLNGGFPGEVHPVNPRASEILGRPCYPSVRDAPRPVDLAVIALPALAVPDVITECADAGVRAAIVLSAGFTESGPDGAALQRELLERSRSAGIRLLGPNCLGFLSTHHDLNAAFAGGMPPSGGVAFLSQSGALGTAILDRAATDGFGVSHFVSLGNRADIAEPDLLSALESDDATTVIAMYLESVGDGPRFLEAAASAVRRKPVIALKSGSSDSGARAVSSHTGSLAGSDVAYEAAFRHAGVIRARTVQELFDLALGFSGQPAPSGSGLAILTNAGGPAVMATDAAEEAGVPMATLDSDTLAHLRESMPDAAALYNPVDVLGDASPERYRAGLRALYADPEVHAILVLLTPQPMTDATAVAHAIIEEAATAPVVTTLACFMGGPQVEEAIRTLTTGSVPSYPTPERAITTLAAMSAYARTPTGPRAVPTTAEAVRRDTHAALERAIADGRTFIGEQAGADVAAAYGIRVPRGAVASNLASALDLADRFGYPVVLKIASPEILHKTDVGGIEVGIGSPEELHIAYDRLLDRARAYAPDAQLDGVHVQEMVPAGREVIIGMDRDSVFGPLLMFGLGGVYVEVLRDVTFRLCPVDTREAERMISEIRAFGLLRGARGEPAADLDAVAEALSLVSALALDMPDIQELDINPLIVGDAGEGAWAVDVRIGIGGS